MQQPIMGGIPIDQVLGQRQNDINALQDMLMMQTFDIAKAMLGADPALEPDFVRRRAWQHTQALFLSAGESLSAIFAGLAELNKKALEARKKNNAPKIVSPEG